MENPYRGNQHGREQRSGRSSSGRFDVSQRTGHESDHHRTREVGGRGREFDVVRRGFERSSLSRGDRGQEPAARNGVTRLRTEIAGYFGKGYTDRTYERRVALSVMDQFMQYPLAGRRYLDMVRSNMPARRFSNIGTPFTSREEYHLAVQTARAYEFGRQFKLIHSDLEKHNPGLVESQIWARAATNAFQFVESRQEDILANPDDIVFCGTLFRDTGRRDRNHSIDAGCAAPMQKYTEEKQDRILSSLGYIRWKDSPPDDWHETFQVNHHKDHTRYLLDASSLALPFQGGQINALEIMDSSTLYDTRIAAKMTISDQTAYYASTTKVFKREDMLEAVRVIKPFLAGDAIEEMGVRLPEEGHSDDFWESWRLHDQNRRSYTERVHPAIGDYTQSVLEDFEARGVQRVRIFDGAGGDGGLAELLLKDTLGRGSTLGIDYYLVDNERDDVHIAQERFEALRSQYPEAFASGQIQTVAACKDLSLYRGNVQWLIENLALPPEGVDIVINSGGLLNQGVAHGTSEARAYYETIYLPILQKPGATLIASGRTPLDIDAQTHRENYMEVHNLYDTYARVQMHVARRPYPPQEV